jgi:mannose/fructose/N-acetylgalactosamine-specific phosphotransferase system component IID
MYIVVVAWMYVVLMMALAEATSANGTVLGAVFTFVLYGVLPVLIIGYILRSPARRAKRRAQEASQEAAQASHQSNASNEAPADAVAPVREKP